jgi:phosphatidylserine/phosphatidylglycerophosphate/cardiolipin synthase-like enzyme
MHHRYIIYTCIFYLAFLILPLSKIGYAQSTWYEVYFSQVSNHLATAKANPRSIDRVLVQKLRMAQSSIDAALHEIDSDRIAQALIAAHQRGVRVRIVTEDDYIDEASIKALQVAGIPIVSDQGHSGLMHNKFLVVDQRFLWTGSYNTTDNGAYKNNNNAIWIESAELAENFTHAFLNMFERRQFGGATRSPVPHPVLTMADGTRIRTAFAPDYDVARFIINELRQAEKSIYFMAFSFTHDGIGKIMKTRFQDGLDVRGVFETRGADSRYAEFESMQALGMTVVKDANKWVMHHKVIIIDGHTVITGSFNFSKNASRSNNENVLIIQGNADIARLYTEEWRRVMGEASEALKPPAASVTLVPKVEIEVSRDTTVPFTGDLNINTASQQQLESLPGIGPELAKRIIAGRPYRRLIDLERVRGLGPRKIEALQGLVVFE